MPNYCKDCCKIIHLNFDPTGKTCYSGMTCDGCDKRLWWYEEALFDEMFEHR